ncbi:MULTISPECIES: LPXTG cell wall anchor domain-containing protein [Eubacteriales]|uniref:LPXTG cell wall anchor domain-containing protein n=1 Tax=Eubacteriales TaxID=186802 RepID=UPI00085C7695|nr:MULTISPECIES: LPXTG cell wall anchor domain-containing protein [Eubacteriales]
MKFKNICAVALSLSLTVGIAVPVFAQETDSNVTVSYAMPASVKIGEWIPDIPDENKSITLENLTPSTDVFLSLGDWKTGVGSFDQHGGWNGPETTDENGKLVTSDTFHTTESFYKPGTIRFQAQYCYSNDVLPTDGDYTKIGDPFTVTVEEPVIQTNAPSSVQSGDTLNLTTELTNTALVNKDTAYYLNENNYSGGMLVEDETHKTHEAAYQPSVEILEGKDIVSQSNQDYSNTLKSSETLTFTGSGTVKLKVTYKQFNTCKDCIQSDSKLYSPEKIITIQVTEKATNITDSVSGIVISGNNLPNDVTLAVKSNDKQAVKNTETALADIGYNEFVAFDITLVDDNGDTVQPNGKVEVSIPLPEKYKGLNNLGIYYIDSNAKAEKMESKIENNCITFETDHFSTYALVAEKEEATNPPAQPEQQKPTTDNPKTGDNSSLMISVLVFVISGTTLIFLFIRKKKHA